MVQWLRPQAFNAGDAGSIPGQGTKIPTCQMAQPKNKNKTNKKRIIKFILHKYFELTFSRTHFFLNRTIVVRNNRKQIFFSFKDEECNTKLGTQQILSNCILNGNK